MTRSTTPEDGPLHPKRCGPCQDCAEAIAEEKALRGIVRSSATPTEPTWTEPKTGNRCHAVITRGDGHSSVPTMPVTLDGLLKHAKRFTAEDPTVPRTVLEVGKAELDAEGVRQLRAGLAGITAAGKRRKRFGLLPSAPRLTDEEILGLDADGRTVPEIVKLTGKSTKTVEKILRAGSRPEQPLDFPAGDQG